MRRRVLLRSLPAGLLAVLGGCGGSPAPAPAPTPAPTPPIAVPSSASADPCASSTAPARQPSLILCLSGAVTGQTLVPDRDTTTCTASGPGTLDGTWVTLVNSIEIRLELEYDGPGDAVVTVVQPATDRSWSSLTDAGPAGRITVDADRSGSLDMTLSPRDLSSGASGTGPALHVRGTFRCPPTSG